MKNSGENSVDSGKTQRGFLDKSAGTRLIFELKKRGLVKMSIKVCTSLTNSSFFQRHNLDALRKSLVVFFCEYFQYFFFYSFFSQVAGKINKCHCFIFERSGYISVKLHHHICSTNTRKCFSFSSKELLTIYSMLRFTGRRMLSTVGWIFVVIFKWQCSHWVALLTRTGSQIRKS